MMNTAGFAPIPRARVIMMTAVNPGDLRKRRPACFRSCILVLDGWGGNPSDLHAAKRKGIFGDFGGMRDGPHREVPFPFRKLRTEKKDDHRKGPRILQLIGKPK